VSLSTASLAHACSRHPARTLVIWGLVVLGSIAAITLALAGFSTDASVTNNPPSERAHHRIAAAFPPDPRSAVTDLVVLRSASATVADASFRRVVTNLAQTLARVNGVHSVSTYYDTGQPALVSADRHATLVPLNMADSAADGVLAVVHSTDAQPGYAVTVTGNATRRHDFNLLSEQDLRTGELQFGIPAALVILLLVFGTVVAGLVPLLMAIVAITTALGLVALLTHLVELSIFTTNMLTGMGLALGIDDALFVISRYRENAAADATHRPRSPPPAAQRAARCCSAAQRSSWPCSACCSCPRRSSAVWPPERSSSASPPSPLR
jgi:uncharacterized membrane protein YdfJ with MMPL/SSD domain